MMKVELEFEDPNDFRRLSNWLCILIKNMTNVAIELQANFIEDEEIIEDAMRQINKKVLSES